MIVSILVVMDSHKELLSNALNGLITANVSILVVMDSHKEH